MGWCSGLFNMKLGPSKSEICRNKQQPCVTIISTETCGHCLPTCTPVSTMPPQTTPCVLGKTWEKKRLSFGHFVKILVFDFDFDFDFVTFWVFEPCHILSFKVLSHFDFFGEINFNEESSLVKKFFGEKSFLVTKVTTVRNVPTVTTVAKVGM